MKINKILNYSSVDGPGNRLVVFTQGCNFNCLYCHNPETIDPQGEGFRLDSSALFDRILEAKPFISGVTFSGGECSLQAEELVQVCRRLKCDGLEVFMDTNFSMEESIYEKLSHVVDRFIVDIKAVDESVHLRLTGSSNQQILKNIRKFYDKIYEVRIVVMPGINDADKDLEDWVSFIRSVDPILPVRLIPFRPHGARPPYDTWPAADPALIKRWIDYAYDNDLKNVYSK